MHPIDYERTIALSYVAEVLDGLLPDHDANDAVFRLTISVLPHLESGSIWMPLTKTFWLSAKSGKKAVVHPLVDMNKKTVGFETVIGDGAAPNGTVNRTGATCISCNTHVPLDYLRREGIDGRMQAQLMAIVAERGRTRVFLAGRSVRE